MDTDKQTTPPDDDADKTHVRIDPRFDEATRQGARAVVPLAENVRVEQPSPSARHVARLRAIVVILFLAVVALVAALVWSLNSRYGTTPVTPITPPPATVEPTALPTQTPQPSPSVSPSVEASPSASPSASSSPNVSPSASPNGSPSASLSSPAAQSPSPTPPPNSNAHSNANLLIPVAGVRADQLRDTFDDARSEGRVHDAIDIMAAKDTPVIAAADGTVVRLFQSAKGGTTLYVRGTDERTIYYYAHLDRYADGITENKFVRRGELLAYVGDTGNAGAGNYHLHFAIWTVDDPKRFWDGNNINPYPLLTGKR